MKKLLLSLLFVYTFISCEKKYSYIEIIKEPELIGNGYDIKEKDLEVIKAKDDTTAYLKAYSKFCIAVKASMLVSEKVSVNFSIPIDFKIIDENGSDITNIKFATKEAKEMEIYQSIAQLGKTSDKPSEIKDKNIVIDSAKVNELIPYFKIEKDEFSTYGKILYEPKSAPKYTSENAIYCYFVTNDSGIGPLRLRIQYYADDWLFFSKVQFSINDKAFEYIPSNTKRDHGGGYIWEWSDEPISNRDKDIIRALSQAKGCKMKLIGDKYYDIKNISPNQCLSIKRTLELYKALGGIF